MKQPYLTSAKFSFSYNMGFHLNFSEEEQSNSGITYIYPSIQSISQYLINDVHLQCLQDSIQSLAETSIIDTLKNFFCILKTVQKNLSCHQIQNLSTPPSNLLLTNNVFPFSDLLLCCSGPRLHQDTCGHVKRAVAAQLDTLSILLL